MKVRTYVARIIFLSIFFIVACNRVESKKTEGPSTAPVATGEAKDVKSQSEQFIKKYVEDEIAARPNGGVRENLKFYLTESSPGKGLTEVALPSGEKLYVQKTPVITATDIATIKKKEDAEGYEFRLDLNAEGTKKMHAATKDNIGKRMAFYFNDEFCSAPIIRETIDSGSIMAFKPKSNLPAKQ